MKDHTGKLISVNTKNSGGIWKEPQAEARLVAGHGVEGDYHAGRHPDRQLSLIDNAVLVEFQGLGIPVAPGVMGENLTVEGLPLDSLAPGTRLRIGDGILIEVVKVRTPCSNMLEVHPDLLRRAVGHSGLMARVLESGVVRPGDEVSIV
jgi:MOSC domain-containing protein YiiM